MTLDPSRDSINGGGSGTGSSGVIVAQAVPATVGNMADNTSGMGGVKFRYTPTTTGNVVISFMANIGFTGATPGGLVQIEMQYGTGPAPNFGDAVTGSPVGTFYADAVADITDDDETTGSAFILTGLTVGTDYWFDLAWATSAIGAPTALTVIDYVIMEIVQGGGPTGYPIITSPLDTILVAGTPAAPTIDVKTSSSSLFTPITWSNTDLSGNPLMAGLGAILQYTTVATTKLLISIFGPTLGNGALTTDDSIYNWGLIADTGAPPSQGDPLPAGYVEVMNAATPEINTAIFWENQVEGTVIVDVSSLGPVGTAIYFDLYTFVSGGTPGDSTFLNGPVYISIVELPL